MLSGWRLLGTAGVSGVLLVGAVTPLQAGISPIAVAAAVCVAALVYSLVSYQPVALPNSIRCALRSA